MKKTTFNHIEKIDENGGDYIVLVDYFCEGISVKSQHKTITGALAAMGETGSPESIVKLVRVELNEVE